MYSPLCPCSSTDTLLFRVFPVTCPCRFERAYKHGSEAAQAANAAESNEFDLHPLAAKIVALKKLRRTLTFC
jgi:hypothetical protein